MSKEILSIDHLSKVYSSGSQVVSALKDVSLKLYEGEIFGLLGVNGAGKTTLSSILATLHPPTSGEILYRGVSIYRDLVGYRSVLGFCPQKQNLDEYLTVEENLIFAGRYHLLSKELIAQRVATLLEELNLGRYAQSKISELSGGTAQRVLIARALIHSPRIVILDEPTVGLDPDIRKKLWEIIRGLKSRGITVILTTHYLDEAEALSDRICILHQGRVRLIESIVDLKATHQEKRLEDIFLHLMEAYQKEQE